MEKSSLTKKIMHKVALVQENRLRKNLKFGVPAISVLTLGFLFAFGQMASDVIAKEIPSIFEGLELDLETLPGMLWDNLSTSWEFIAKGPVFLFISALVLAILVFIKINPLLVLKQMKEIARYKTA